ncbi:cysteine desulfurase family protein [Microbacterium dextranolyticum]|uniref:Cysteine desulfurase n=1 Tax=Microbacterium dextranolyticum TaxID=36806 RepID=A0A9W6HP15_9MICO|nr:cysteine desulfurase family protein [Microbacterium dextranolyticum]MBM7462810.1 cysteine desulfurase [Microbacterium dextranolyticum]GLJ96085.1 cysteine desulfurase [Microbacterium dextranolyticum]
MIYLDHAASAPLRASARDAWIGASAQVGNASSVHGSGQVARRLLEESRERVAAVLGCEPIEVVFTSSGTESVNLALKGLWWARGEGTQAIVLPDGEHHATLDTVGWLATQDAEVRSVPLDEFGRITAAPFSDALDGAALATALVVNNEVGTVQDAPSLARAASDAGVPLHLDAVGAVGHVPVVFDRWRGEARGSTGLVALSLSGHKFGAPVGTGALVVSRHAALVPLLHGGGQQRGLRSGTPDVPGAAALAAALEEAVAELTDEASRLTALAERLITGIRRAIPAAELLGDPLERIPGNVHVLFPGAAGESLLFLLDQAGISVSTGSACQAGVAEPSHVVLALGRDERAARSVLRMTLGRTSTAEDVDAVLAALPEAYARASGAGAARRS